MAVLHRFQKTFGFPPDEKLVQCKQCIVTLVEVANAYKSHNTVDSTYEHSLWTSDYYSYKQSELYSKTSSSGHFSTVPTEYVYSI